MWSQTKKPSQPARLGAGGEVDDDARVRELVERGDEDATPAHRRIGQCPSGPFKSEREGETMPLYLIEVQLHAGDLGPADGKPEDRRDAAQSYIESVGGKLHGFWYAFGAHDGYTLWEAPTT